MVASFEKERHDVIVWISPARIDRCRWPFEPASAQGVITFETYKGADPPNVCAAPPAANSFSLSDTTVNVYMLLGGISPGDNVQIQFFPPGSATSKFYWYWQPAPNDGYTNRCYWARISITQWFAAILGTWSAQVTVNSNPVGSPITFDITNNTSGPVTANYEGYLDGIDCNHIFGWARDKNSPGQAVNVDLFVDGQKLTTILAGDYRSDLPDGGNHAFNYYSLPASLKNGNVHNVTASVVGSTFQLAGSPKSFQNPCTGTIITSANQWTYNTNAFGNPQNGWWARLVKTPVSGNRYKYSMYLFLSSGTAILNASAAIITDLRIGMVRGSYGTQVLQSLVGLAPQPNQGTFQWQDPPNFDRANSITNIAFDIWGFQNEEVGYIWGAKDIIDNLRDLSRATIGPSPWLTDKMLNENTYRVSRMAYTPSNGIFTALSNVTGINFNVTVDENAGLQPEFFLRMETKLGTVIGVEIGLDRQALLSTATWNPF